MKAALCLFALASLSPLLVDEEEARIQEHARATVQHFYAGEVETLWKGFDAKLRAHLGSPENLKRFQRQVGEQLGQETQVASEALTRIEGGWSYRRVASFEKLAQPIEVLLAFDTRQRTTGFLIRPVPAEAPSEYLDYETKTRLRLPFEGEWTVFWGGRALADNYHAANPDQRFAYDFLATVDGSSHRGEGKANEDYHCFDRPILAPAAGTVVVAVDGVEDNVPGEMNPKQPPGNHVILDHGNGEFSLLAHFRKGTLAVEPGDEVAPGALLGRCGNSGNSSEPHLHVHLQTTAVFGQGDGLPAPFVDYVADGQPVERGEPTKGQHVSPR